MALDNGIIPQQLEGDFFNDPQLIQPPSLELNPFNTPALQSFNSGAGAPPVDFVENSLEGFINKPASDSTLAAPTFFDYNASQADRYVNSKNYNQLGFDPRIGQNNEYKYGALQTWGDVWGNGLTGMFKIAGNTFIEGWKGWSNIASSIGSWDASKMLGTPEELMEQDKSTKDIMNKYAIYSTPESESGLFNKKFFGDMLQQSGFAVGTIAQFLSEELLTFGLSTEFSLAKLGLRAPAWAGKVVTKADVMADMVRLGDHVWTNPTISQKLIAGARNLVPFGNTAYALSKYGRAGAGALQLASITVGGLRRMLSEANMAFTEARMEAAGTYADLYTKLYDEELRKTGEMPDPTLVERMQSTAKDAAYDNFWVNSGILMLSNRLQFDNVLGKFSSGRRLLGDGVGEFAEDVLRVEGKKIGTDAVEQSLKKVYQKGRLGTIGLAGEIAKDFGARKAAWEVTKSIGRNVFKWETSEGLQELFQDVSNNTLQNYYYDLYHGKKGSDLFDKSLTKAVEQEASMQGLKTFLMGAVTGRLISPINFAVGQAKLYGGTTAAERKSRKDDIKNQIKLVNAFYENPNKFLNEHIANVKVQDTAAKNMQDAIANKDHYVYTNNKNSAFAKMVSAAIKTDSIDSVVNTLRTYGQAFTDDQFKDAFGLDKTSDNVKSVNEFFDKVANETIEFHKTWKNLKEKYGDKVMVDLYKEGSPERKTALIAKRALDDAIEMLATNDYKARQTILRAAKLQNEIAEVPVIGSSAAIGFRNLGVIQNTQKEIDILKAEIQNQEAVPTKDKASKQLLKAKKEQLKHLENWMVSYEALNNMTRGNKRKATKSRKAFENYINAKNAESNIDTVIKSDDLQDMYEKLLDYIELNKDHKDYIDAYNILANPIQFVNVHKRLMSSIENVGKKFEEEHKEEINNELVGGKKTTTDGKPLHTVKLEEDGTYSVISPKGNVVAKDIKTEAEAKQTAEELDAILQTAEDRPDNIDKDDEVIESKNGMYLIKSIDTENQPFYYIANKQGNPVGVALDEQKYPDYDPNGVYDTFENAKKYFDALVELSQLDYKEYTFDGKTLKYGTILVTDKNRKFKVLTKGEPRKIKGIPNIVIQPLSGNMSTYTIPNLNGYRLEEEFQKATKPENPNALRIKRNNELVRIYPKKTSFDEELSVAEARLKNLIHTTPKDQLIAGISIRITKNKNLQDPSLMEEGKDTENRHIQLNPETHMIEIMYNGETIGFATYYNRYTYLNDEGQRTSLDSINKKQFEQIFDPGDKDVNAEFDKFKKNYAQSRQFFSTLVAKLGKEETITLTPEETNKLFTITPSAGEYNFTAKNDPVISLDDLEYNTIEGETYIIDRRTKYLGEGMYEEDPRIQSSAGVIGEKKRSIEERVKAARYEGGEDKLRNYGRYVAVVELPNGAVKFVELTSSPIERVELDDMVKTFNQKSQELKEKNLTDKVDSKGKPFVGSVDPNASSDVNSKINSNLYIAVQGRRGMKVNLSMTPTGNVRVEFATFKYGEKTPVKRDLIISESSADPRKPLALKDSIDLIERINRAIEDHDANDKNILKKIGVKLNIQSFKRSLAEDSDINEYRQLLSNVNKSVVKNEGIFFSTKKGETSPSSVVVTATSTGRNQKQTGTDPVIPSAENVIVTAEDAAKSSELLKRRKEELERLKKEQEEKGKVKRVQDQIHDLLEEKDKLLNVIRGELLAKGMSRKDTMTYNYDSDARIQEINRKVAELNGGAALKVSENLSHEDIVNIEEFSNWVKENLPEFISVEELKNMRRQMKKSGMTVGMFYTHLNNLRNRIEGKIAVGKDSGFKYHEAFHAVFRLLLTEDQIEKYLDIAKKELQQQGKSLSTLKKELLESKPEFYSKLTDRQLEEAVYEEYLADKFDAWKLNNKVKTSPENKSLFRKFIDFIKSIFRRFNRSPLEQLFTNINTGKFSNKNVILNRFTENAENVGVTLPAFKSIKVGYRMIDNEDGERERIPIYLSEEEGSILTSTIAALYHKRMREAGLNTHRDDIMNDVFATYQELYDRTTNGYYDSDDFVDRFGDDLIAYKKSLEKVDQKFKIFSNPELIEDLKKSVYDYLTIFSYKDKELEDSYDDSVQEYGDRVTTDNWKESYSIGGFGSLSQELRQYLSTIVEETIDEFGNTRFLNGQPLIEAANANVLYNGILKAVAGSVSDVQALDRLKIFAEHNPEAKKFWEKFSADVDIQYDEEGNFVDIGNKDQATLFQAVIKGFSQFAVDYYFINKDIGTGESRIIEANRKGAAKNQFSIWYNAFLRKFVDEYEMIPKDAMALSEFFEGKTRALNDLATILKVGNVYSADVLNENLKDIITELKNELGISLSPLFLKYSYLTTVPADKLSVDEARILKAFDGVQPMTEEDAREIATIIKSGKNPFGTNIDPQKIASSEEQLKQITNYENLGEGEEVPEGDEEKETEVNDDVDSAIGRLTKIAASNSVFDEQVTTSSYKNAEGELVYAHQLPTFNLIRANELQSGEFRNQLKKDEFLKTNYLLNNRLFDYIADGFKVFRIDGIKDSSLRRNDRGDLVEDKRLNVNQNKGVTYGSMSDREFMISLFELYANNKKYIIPESEGAPRKEFMTSTVLMGVLEASNTADVVNLPIIKAVEYSNGKIVLTSEMKNALFEEIKREFNRISRVKNEIDAGFPNGVIEGYHNGDPAKGGTRGLRFIKMGNILGELKSQLEESAKNKEDIQQYRDEIFFQMEKYFLGEGGKVDQMIDSLVNQNIIERNEKNELRNNLLNRYLFRGFEKDGKSDPSKNAMGNIIANAPRYNIAQVMMNNFINTLSVRQLFIGDAAENYKDDGGIDEVKRNKGLNGSGASIYSTITAPQFGITHKNEKSYVAIFNDPMYKGKYAGKNKEKADAQMYITTKTLRYILFGLGKLNKAQAELLDKIEKGISVTTDDIFGELYRTSEGVVRTRGGSIEYNAQTNSLKLVYNDGKMYNKISAVILSKELTSVNVNGKWEARPGYEELHTLREKLETFQEKNQTITFGLPKSGSKGLKKNIASNISSITDNNFTEHDNRFWRLQLENPSNKTIITDPTQAKQLIIAEQSRDLVVNFRGEEMKLGDVIDKYLSNTAQRVRNNYFSSRDEMFDIEQGFKELNKSISQNQITPKLGKFLQRSVQVLSSTGADAQLIEFFTPEFNSRTGEYVQKYDLNNSITLDKFTQLFLAYYSKGVMSEKVPGHTYALMSNHGMLVTKRVVELDEKGQPKRWEVIRRSQYESSPELFENVKNAKRWNNELDRQFDGLKVGDYYLDDLRHNVPEYDEKGNITGYFTEFMAPPHYREDMGIGTEEDIPDHVAKAFAVRIPSQDKHSFVTPKLVDFLPAYYGSTAVFPHELIEISGADFDIDKVYTHIYDTYRKNGQRVPYGQAKTNEEKYNEYLIYLSSRDKAFKAKLNELRKIDVNDVNPNDIDGYLEPEITYESIDELVNDLLKKDRNALILQSALRELNLPTNVKEYVEYVEKNGEPNNGVLNNLILDAKIKMLNNERMVTAKENETPIAFQVAEVQPLLDAIDNFIDRFPILRDILIETGEDVDSMMGQYKSFKNNKEGARNIGPAVNSMLVYAIMNAYNVSIRNKDGKGNPLFVLTIDGHEFNSYGNSKAYNSEKGEYSGERIFYHISAIVSAMTDNAKERLAARLGLNINAIDVVSNMVALGVPLETALMFNLQPSVRKYYEKVAVSEKRIKTSAENQLRKSKVGDDILKQLEDALPKGITIPEITTSLLENNIKSNGTNPEVDYAIFKAFHEFNKQTIYFSKVAGILKLTKGLGTTNEEIDKFDQREEDLGLNMSDPDFSASKIPFDLRQVLKGVDESKPHHAITANYIKIKNQIKALQKSVFLERTYMYKRLRETVLSNLSVTFKEKESFEKTLKRDIIAYLGIKAYMNYLKVNGKSVKLKGLDNALIYEASAVQRGEDFMDIIDTVKKIREKMPDNYFAHAFLNMVPVGLKDVNNNQEYINPNTKGGINLLDTNTWAKLGYLEQRKLEDSFMDIYSTNRELALTLFNYLIVKDGGQFKSGSFIKFIPPAMFTELFNSFGDAHALLKRDEMSGNDEAYRDIFGVTAKELFNEFTTLYTTNYNNAFNIKSVNLATKLSAAVEEKRPKGYNPEVVKRPLDPEDPTKFNDDMFTVDMFGGIRKAEPTLLEDEQGNQFIAETIATGAFDEPELEKLSYNKAVLKARGFNVVNVPNEKGENRYYMELPYTVKYNFGTRDMPRVVYYRLATIGKGKEAVTDKGLGSMIREVGQNMVLSTVARYEKFEPTGSKYQWKVGGVTGEMPANIVLRKRTVKNSDPFDMLESIEDQIEKIEMQLAGVDSLQLEAPVQDLQKDWGIYTRMVGNKVTYYKREKGKEVEYDPQGAKSPQELLDRLNASAPVSTNVKMATIEKPAEQAPVEQAEKIEEIGKGLENVVIDKERAKRNFQAILAERKIQRQVEEQKKKDDKGCKEE